MAARRSARDTLYLGLERRNKIVGLLRYAVPGAGIALAGFLIFQIILSNLAQNFGIEGIRLEQDQLVLDRPSYSGITPDGTIYEIVADDARAGLVDVNNINLTKAQIDTRQTDGYSMTAIAQLALLDLSTQEIFVEGVMETRDSNGVRGRLTNSTINWPEQVLTARGAVRFDFKDGAAIEAQSLVYNAKEQIWDFRGVRYTVPGDGGL